MQGPWQGTLTVGKTQLRLTLKIAETSPGNFQALMDSVDQGAMNMPVTSLTYQKPEVHFVMTMIDGDFVGNLNNTDDRMVGTWKQRGAKWPLTFDRMKTNLVVEDAQKDYGSGAKSEMQGHWKGALSVKGMQLHLVINLAQMPDGSYTATMDSPDQGAAGIPATSAECNYPNVKITWDMMKGVYAGKMSNGKLSGTWTQGKMSFPLNLEKDTAQ